MSDTKKAELEKAYAESLEAVRASEKRLAVVVDAYRLRKATDAEFLAARAAHKPFADAFDTAHAAIRATVDLTGRCFCGAVAEDSVIDGPCEKHAPTDEELFDYATKS
jgi:hypothetical protein